MAGFRCRSTRSRYVLLTIIILQSLILATIMAARAGVSTDQMEATANAFASYEDFIPGLPLPDAVAQKCLPKPLSRGLNSNRRLCNIFPEDGPFHLITLATMLGRITEATFYSESLQFDALLARWQEPDRSRRSQTGEMVTLYWNQANYTVSAAAILLRQPPHVRLVRLTMN